MLLTTEQDCTAYVQTELDHLIQSHPEWQASRSTEFQAPPLSWTLWRSGGCYTLEARMDQQEFLIWFGNHQVGAGGVHWIVRPAVHVAFQDLWPRSDPIAIRHSLADVLEYMVISLRQPSAFMSRFDLNTQSPT